MGLSEIAPTVIATMAAAITAGQDIARWRGCPAESVM